MERKELHLDAALTARARPRLAHGAELLTPIKTDRIPKITAAQVPQSQWLRGDYRPIACLRYSAEELERRLNASFADGVEDGLGAIRLAGFQMPSGRRFGLIQYLNAPGGPAVEVNCLHDDRFPTDLDEVLDSLDMDLSDVAVSGSRLAVSQEVSLAPHVVWRQDDNGSRDLIGVFLCRANATKRMRAFEAAGHKQTYWVERQTG